MKRLGGGRLRTACAIFAATWTCSAIAAHAAEGVALDAPTVAFLKQHCAGCHGAAKAESELRLDVASIDLSDTAVFDRWHEVVDRLRAGEMPPEGEPRPPAADVAAVVRRLSSHLDAAAARHKTEGRVVLRRLNRAEYENTVRDLLAVDVNVKEMLPEDTISLGFDNVGAALNVSPVLVERYLEAADAVITAAIKPVTTLESTTETHRLVDSLPSYFKGVYDQRGEAIFFRSETPSQLSKWRARETGNYRFRIQVRAHQSDVPLAVSVLVGNFNTAAGSARHIGYYDVDPGPQRTLEIVARLNQRETIKVQPVWLPKVYVKQESFLSYPGPGLGIGDLTVEGPLPEARPTESYRRVLGDVDPKSATAADAVAILGKLLPRAFRRPTTDADLAPYLKLTTDALDAGKPFDEAMRVGIKGMLCSPKFLYFREPAGPLDDYALASRLSYFLWSSLPDDELFDLAARGELQKPEVLRAQAERMLRDPKAERFVDNFTGQWLSLRDIDFTTPDAQLYPEYEELLRWSMLRESQLFFAELLNEDLSVLNFIDSDFTMLNQRLAAHYGIDGVTGFELRKVKLPTGSRRGGVLTQAAVLKVTANGTTTSPVVRGVWVADHLLADPPKPPPPNVPAIEPDIRGATTIREQLAKHRETAACAGCHAKIDPPGFALENFDVIGGWREQYRAVGTKDKVQLPPTVYSKYAARPSYGWGLPVEAGDELPDGRKFADIDQFKQLLLADPDAVARAVTEKLMVYATGGGLEYGDHAEIDAIVGEVKPKHYGLRSILSAIVASELFRTK